MKPGFGMTDRDCGARARGRLAAFRVLHSEPENRRHAHLRGHDAIGKRPIPRHGGFTLFEMLAVILLIGIAAAAVSVSVTQGLARARVNAASGEIVAALRATRAQAIVQQREETFDVDVQANTWSGAKRRDVKLPKGLKLAITSALEDRPDAHTGRIRFFPDGSSTGGHIVLTSGQRAWRINVSWLTGGVAVVDDAADRAPGAAR